MNVGKNFKGFLYSIDLETSATALTTTAADLVSCHASCQDSKLCMSVASNACLQCLPFTFAENANADGSGIGSCNAPSSEQFP